MAKFCSNCGSPLEDGKPCACMETASASEDLNQAAAEVQAAQPALAEAPQEPAPAQAAEQPAPAYFPQPKKASPVFADLSGFLKSFFKAPVSAVKDFADKGNFLAGLILVAVNLLLAAIVFTMIYGRSIWYVLPIGWERLLGGKLPVSLTIFLGRMFRWAGCFFGTIIGYAVMYGAVSGVVYLGGSVVLKKNCSYPKVLAALAASTVPMTLALVAALIFGFVNFRFAYNLIAAGTVAFFLMLLSGARQAIDAEEDAGFMIVAAGGLVFYILYALVTRIIGFGVL